MKLFAADRRKPTLLDGVVALCVVALAAALAFAVIPGQTKGDVTAVVTLDGNTIAVLPLFAPDAAEESKLVQIDDGPYPLVLEYKIGAIRVAEAHCPGKDCTRIGWISKVGEQIICLPNRIIITITGEDAASFDAVTG